MTDALELVALSKSYASRDRVLNVLTDVTLRVSPGQVVWLRGASGTGKTTLLCIAGLLSKPTAGTVLIDGEPAIGLSGRHSANLRARKLGFVFQQHNLIAGFTALENVALPALARQSAATDRARQLLSSLGLAERIDYQASLLSGGERQRVAIARALINEPAVILADEPISGLDADAASEVLKQLSQAAHNGCAVIIASHDAAVAAVANRSVAVCDGTLSEQPVAAPTAGDMP